MGENINQVQTQYSKVMWVTHSRDYCKAEMTNLENTLMDNGKRLSQYRDGRRPYPSIFHQDIDTSTELDENGDHEYQNLMGMLRWSIKLGRIYIMTTVSCLSLHL